MIERACCTRLRGVAAHLHSTHANQLRHTRFHLRLRQLLHAVRIIRRGVEHAAHCDYSDTHAIHIGTQQIGAMPWRLHPFLVNRCRIRTNGHILFDEIEARSHLCRAIRETILASVAMRNRSLGRHAQASALAPQQLTAHPT